MKLGVYVGRFSPLHLGHEAVIKAMLRSHGYKNSVLAIGGSNHDMDERHLFSYHDRRNIIGSRYPLLSIVGIPDYEYDADWMTALLDILALKGHYDSVMFYAGCNEDVQYFIDRGFTCKVLNRYDGSRSPVVSATQVRTALLQGTSLKGLVNPQISDLIKERFDMRWKEFITK